MIIDSDLYNACIYAEELENNGDPTGLANYKAGNKYYYNAKSVAKARAMLKKRKKEVR